MKNQSITLIRRLTLACAVSLLLAGCGKGEEQTSAAAAASTPITATPAAATTAGTELDDSVVTAKVKTALLADHDAKSFEIQVETRKGQVQLSGFVDTQERIEKAVALTRTVEGVKGVENAMSVKDGKTTVGNNVDDGVVTAKVKAALLADSDIKSLDIAVITRKGEVQLSGFVDNQNQITRAMEVARGVEGVQRIGNEMSIKK